MSTPILRTVRFEGRTDPKTGKRIIENIYDDVDLELQANGQPTAAVSRKVFNYIQDMVREGGYLEMSAYNHRPKPKMGRSEALNALLSKLDAYFASRQQTVEIKAARMRVAKSLIFVGYGETGSNESLFQGLPNGRDFYTHLCEYSRLIQEEYEVVPDGDEGTTAKLVIRRPAGTTKNNPKSIFKVGDRVRHVSRKPVVIGTVSEAAGLAVIVKYDGYSRKVSELPQFLEKVSPLEELALVVPKRKPKRVPWQTRDNPSVYTKRTGNQYGLEAELAREYIDMSKEMLPNGAPRYYITFHDVLKVGIKPKPTYNTTPVGVYTYPLSGVWPFNLGEISEAIPYAGKSKYASILEAIDPQHMSVLSHESEQAVYRRLRKEHMDKPIAFNTALRRAGATSVYDPDLGLIHAHEPEQAVFLVPSAYKVLRTVPVSVFRRALNLEDMQIRSGVGRVDESDYYKSGKYLELAP